MEQKNKELKEKNTEKTKQLKQSQKEASKLKEILDQLKNDKLISQSEQDLLNVSNFCVFE